MTCIAPHVHAQPSGRYDALEYARIVDPGASSVIRQINNRREVAGGFRQADARHTTTAVLLTGTAQLDLTAGLLTDYSAAFGINDEGEVVGTFNGPIAVRPFRSVRNAGFIELPSLPGDSGGGAFAVNVTGEAAGYSSGPSGERAVWWTRTGEIRELPSPSGASTRALGINNRGDIVGVSGDEARRGVLWAARGTPLTLGTLAGFMHSEAVSINESGDIVGFAMGTDRASQRSRAVLWAPGGRSIRDLGALVDGGDSRARDVNARGEVVGISMSPDGHSRAFLWTARTGMVDLNTLVSLPGLELIDALSVNRNGDIVAVAQEQHHDDRGGSPPGHPDHEVPRRVLVLTPRP